MSGKLTIEDNGRGFQGAETNPHHKRPLSTLINQERLAILSRQTKTAAKLTVVDKKATAGKRGVSVELILPFKWRTDQVPPLNKLISLLFDKGANEISCARSRISKKI